jgi:predicted DNA-binding transcriptional regulator AlpA
MMQEKKQQQSRLLRLPAVRDWCPFSRPQLYRLMKRKVDPFPAPLHIAGGTASFWREDDVLAWLERNLSDGQADQENGA